MKKIERAEVLNLVEYEKAREAMRARVIALKKNRRVGVGENLTFLFENRETVLFQIQEMVRTERIVDDSKVQEEVDAYNALIPVGRRALGHALHRDSRSPPDGPRRGPARP